MTRYSGLIWGSVYDANGVYMPDAETHFWDADPDLFVEISNIMREHVRKYIHVGYFQSGFGGDDRNGCIDYAWHIPAPQVDPMPFEISGCKYTMRFSAPPNTIV